MITTLKIKRVHIMHGSASKKIVSLGGIFVGVLVFLFAFWILIVLKLTQNRTTMIGDSYEESHSLQKCSKPTPTYLCITSTGTPILVPVMWGFNIILFSEWFEVKTYT